MSWYAAAGNFFCSVVDKAPLSQKENNFGGEDIGNRISALANSACLHGQSHGYLVFGIEDETKRIVGVDKHFSELRRGKEELEQKKEGKIYGKNLLGQIIIEARTNQKKTVESQIDNS